MSMHEDECEKCVKNLKKGIQWLAIQLSVCVFMSENGQSEHNCTVCTHEWLLSAKMLK